MMLYLFGSGNSREGGVAGENLLTEEESWDWPCSDSKEVILFGRGSRDRIEARARWMKMCAENVLSWLRSDSFL